MAEANHCPRCNARVDNPTFENRTYTSGGETFKEQTGRCDCGCIVAHYDRPI